MRAKNDGGALTGAAENRVLHAADAEGIETGEGLVKEHDFGAVQETAGDGKFLLHTAGKISKDREGNVKDYPPTQSLSLKQRNGAWMTEMYDSKKQAIEGASPMDVLRKGAEVTPMCDASSIWIADKKFGLSWSLFQALVNTPGEGGAYGCQIQDEDDNIPVVVATAVSEQEEKSLMKAVLPADDEEDEDEEEDEGEVIPAPPVPAKKAAPAPVATVKKVVKKVAKA